MNIFTNTQYKDFKNLCRMTQSQLLKHIKNFLYDNKYSDVIATPDYIVGIGNIPITLVAHLDTVFTEKATQIYYDKEQSTIWSPQGLGADDRAGVFAIYELINRGYHPHVIFTTDEESGCIGAQKFVRANPLPLFDTKYIVQLDRRGAVDCVFYDCENQPFTDYISSFGFVPAFGTFSDISVIAPKWGIAAVNLSVGYFKEHTQLETLNTKFLLNTIDAVEVMMLDIEAAEYFEYKSDIPKMFWDDFFIDSCDICNKQFYDYEIMYAMNAEGTAYLSICPDCIVDNVDWCKSCNEGFVHVPNQSRVLCPSCRKKKKGDPKTNDYFTGRATGDKRPL